MQQAKPTHSQSGSNNQIIPHARMSRMRFVLLLLLILVNLVNQYSFDNPQALEDTMESVLGISQSQFQLFYSLYALPNIVTLFFVGYYCDKLGVRLSLLIMSGGVAVFQLFIAIGGFIQSYAMILTGRILFGLFSQALFIPIASMISIWFQGTEQSFALGVGITFPQLGNAFNSFLTPLIYEKSGNLGIPLLFSFGLCVVGFAMACLAAYVDKRADRIDQQNKVHIVLHQEGEAEEIKMSDAKKLRRQYWLAAVIASIGLTLWIPFLDNVNRMFQKRFCYSETSAGNAVSIAYFSAVFFSVPLGIATDKFGRRRILTVVGLGIFFVAQFIMLIYPQCQEGDSQSLGAIAGLVFQGLGFAFYSNVFIGIIPLVCKLNLLGTAFGLMEIIMSFLQFIVPLISGAMVGGAENPSNGYRYSSTMFTIISLIGLIISAFLFFAIKDHYKKKLDRSSHENLLHIARLTENPQLASSWSNTQDELQARRTSEGNNNVPESDSLSKPLLSLQIQQ